MCGSAKSGAIRQLKGDPPDNAVGAGASGDNSSDRPAAATLVVKKSHHVSHLGAPVGGMPLACGLHIRYNLVLESFPEGVQPGLMFVPRPFVFPSPFGFPSYHSVRWEAEGVGRSKGEGATAVCCDEGEWTTIKDPFHYD